MAEQYAPISETGLGYDVFAPLWGILELGAVVASGSGPLEDVSLAGFVAGHRDELDRLLAVVRDIGDFSAETMAIFEQQGGWTDGRAVTPEYLMMYSGCIEAYPPAVDDPLVLRRMVRMGSDLQLATLMHALVGAAVVRGPGLAAAPELVVGAVRAAGSLLSLDTDHSASDVFRMWRVKFLPDILRPDAPAREGAKEGLRQFAHALEARIDR
ncbi:hypothetical protein [Streptomyces sp. NPDC127072]|uniref:hypothetical protein n=1 Tax=Streptomyces sp. NPDC127072 TaxID=3347129 RepID=UPI0036468D8E